jgi:hypothetical protein
LMNRKLDPQIAASATNWISQAVAVRDRDTQGGTMTDVFP